MAMDEDSYFDNVDVLEGSSTPMDWKLVCLHETMAEITVECRASASIELWDHAMSLLQRVASNIYCICLAQANEYMHLKMVFFQVDDGFKNSIN
jgi:hypothetical protein